MTPLLVDPAHPFPYISGLSLNLAGVVADPQAPRKMFARVKVPPLLPRLCEVSPRRFISLEDMIAAHLVQLKARKSWSTAPSALPAIPTCRSISTSPETWRGH